MKTWIAIWGWQTPQLPRPEKVPNQNHEEGEDCRYNKTLDLCGLSQNLHFDKYDGLKSGRYVWYQVIVMVTAPFAVAADGDCLYKCFTYFEKEKFTIKIFVVVTNPELMLINIFSPTFVPNSITLTWKNKRRDAKTSWLIKWPILCTFN